MKKPVRYHGFLHTLNKKDKRVKKYQKQLKERGFDDTEMWSLDIVIANFVLPRLKHFRKQICATEWRDKLDNAIYAFELIASDSLYDFSESKKVEKGLKDFATIFGDLWT